MNWPTHEISNQYDELKDYNLYRTDQPLNEALARAGAEAFAERLSDYGAQLGTTECYALADSANRFTPELHTHDGRGRRLDQVLFHPSWHALLAMYRAQGLIALPFDNDSPGRWSAWAAGFYLHTQVEAGSLCPATMTQAAIPVLAKEPHLNANYLAQLQSRDYDARDIPIAQKRSIWIGMGMTEKQGGSDVRANTTLATPIVGSEREFTLRGHKWFFSAPMSDAHLVVAKTLDGAPSCFFVPRWRPDGSKNALELQRLKDKVGNRSNSSSEVEFKDAYGVLLGEPGRGIPTIIEMASYTRLNCVVGSAGMVRQALVQSLAYTRQHHAFGRPLAEQPLMQSVLADLALENEANVVLMMRLAQAYERDDTPVERAWKRIMTPAAKFWVCKRAVEITGETMEIFGGNGYVDTGVMARLYREAPVNSIWEGSGNVMCLDVLRAIAKEPALAVSLLDALQDLAHADRVLAVELQELRQLMVQPELEAAGRMLSQRLIIAAQACLMRQHLPDFIADAFVSTRYAKSWGGVVGSIDIRKLPFGKIIERALPIQLY